MSSDVLRSENILSTRLDLTAILAVATIMPKPPLKSFEALILGVLKRKSVDSKGIQLIQIEMMDEGSDACGFGRSNGIVVVASVFPTIFGASDAQPAHSGIGLVFSSRSMPSLSLAILHADPFASLPSWPLIFFPPRPLFSDRVAGYHTWCSRVCSMARCGRGLQGGSCGFSADSLPSVCGLA
ncbi:hypothetical protein RHGRI_006714 [Rhododendron griersonianum]|uniref:Uncharacterized protein n=1 Tax=Rhododendron griersonianum TaxID=479676 RepID=A0AAV6KVT2_9ERIC|nr:hypothetical protein RHGRI_006714 [Rhododendron griersonianum]